MTEIQKTISDYLRRSAGNGNHISDHTATCFLGMLQTGEATLADFRQVAGDGYGYVVTRIRETAQALNLNVPGDGY